MSPIIKFLSILFSTLTLLCLQPAQAQDKLSWLDDFTGEMQIGSDTYQYNFTRVEENDCKMKFEELVTDKKGSTESRFWIFYLSDMNPSALSFKVFLFSTYRFRTSPSLTLKCRARRFISSAVMSRTDPSTR